MEIHATTPVDGLQRQKLSDSEKLRMELLGLLEEQDQKTQNKALEMLRMLLK